MTKYLISFPGSAMDLSEDDFVAAGVDSRAVVQEAKDAGVYVFGGGIDEGVAPVMVASDGSVTNETYPQTREFDGGFFVLELESREAALVWAAKTAAACRCGQELREFMFDPES
ncbi:MAG: transcription initiation protein [Rhodoglobus sp.]